MNRNRRSMEKKAAWEGSPKETDLEMSSFQNFPPLPRPLGQTPTGGSQTDEFEKSSQEDEVDGKMDENNKSMSLGSLQGGNVGGDQPTVQFDIFSAGRTNGKNAFGETVNGGAGAGATSLLFEQQRGSSRPQLPESQFPPGLGIGESRDLGYVAAAPRNGTALDKSIFYQQQISSYQQLFNQYSSAQVNSSVAEQLFKVQLQEYQMQSAPPRRPISLAVGDGRPVPGTSAGSSSTFNNGQNLSFDSNALGGVYGHAQDAFPPVFNKGPFPTQTASVGTQTESKFIRSLQTNLWGYGSIGGNYEAWFFPDYADYTDVIPSQIFRGNPIDNSNGQYASLGKVIAARQPNYWSISSSQGANNNISAVYLQDFAGNSHQTGPAWMNGVDLTQALEQYGSQNNIFPFNNGAGDFGQGSSQHLYQRADYNSNSFSEMFRYPVNPQPESTNAEQNQIVSVPNTRDSGYSLAGVDRTDKMTSPGENSIQKDEVSSTSALRKVVEEMNQLRTLTLTSPVKEMAPLLKWAGTLLPKDSSSPLYSEKIFVGGIDPKITKQDITEGFRRFEVVDVAWCSKDSFGGSDKFIQGCAYVTLRNKNQVKKLIASCEPWTSQVRNWKGQRTYHYVMDYRNKKTLVEVILWDTNQGVFYDMNHRSVNYAHLKNIFLGNLHARFSAKDIANFFSSLGFPDVVIIRIGTDKTDYPTGFARVSFTSSDSFIRAIRAKKLIVETPDFSRVLQIEPFIDYTSCSRCNNHSAALFCKNDSCLKYYCNGCHFVVHTTSTGFVLHTGDDMVKRSKVRIK